jgi:DNA-binding Lrp family transcriptional regulator
MSINGPRSLNPTDIKIISILQNDPEATQQEIAKKLRISQPSVGARLNRLKKSGILNLVTSVEPLKMGLHLAQVDSMAVNPIEVIDYFLKCPLFINGFITTGKYNLRLLFTSEDLISLEALVNNHFRNNPNIKNVEMSVVLSTAKDLSINELNLSVHQNEESPCGHDCKVCTYYNRSNCSGCPATHFYRGNFWKGNKINGNNKSKNRVENNTV